MELIYCDLRLDLSDNRTLQTVRLKQYDDGGGKRIHITLYNNGEPVTLDDNTEVSLYASVGKTILAAGSTNNCGVDTAATGYDYGYIYINVTEELTSIAGTVKCDVRITTSSTEYRVHTATFYLDVEPSAVTADMTTAASTSNIFDVIESDVEEAVAEAVETAVSTAVEEATESLLSTYYTYTRSMINYLGKTLFGATITTNATANYETTLAYRGYVTGTISAYDPDNGDVLLIWINSKLIMSTSGITLELDSTGSYYTYTITSDVFHNAVDSYDDDTTYTLYIDVWNIPTTSSSTTYGTTTASTSGTTESADGTTTASTSGTTESADGTTTATTSGTTASVYGVATETTADTDEETDTDTADTDTAAE